TELSVLPLLFSESSTMTWLPSSFRFLSAMIQVLPMEKPGLASDCRRSGALRRVCRSLQRRRVGECPGDSGSGDGGPYRGSQGLLGSRTAHHLGVGAPGGHGPVRLSPMTDLTTALS